MCGRCRNVFNAFQSLMRVADEDAPATLAQATPQSRPAPLASRDQEESSPELTDAIFLREEPRPLSTDFTQTDFASDVRERDVAKPAIAPAPAPPPLPPVATLVLEDIDDLYLSDEITPVETSAARPTGIGSLLPAQSEKGEPVDENPLLAPASSYRQAPKPARRGLWISGAVLMLLTLTAQLAYAYRSMITQAWPQARPAYMTACEWIGCTLSWGRDDNAIRIEASDLIEAPGKAGRILLTATLVNRGSVRQDLPSLELKLTDNGNQVILSRVLQPSEYLGRVPAKDESLAPNVEMYVNLSFEVNQKAPASGYGVRAFYN